MNHKKWLTFVVLTFMKWEAKINLILSILYINYILDAITYNNSWKISGKADFFFSPKETLFFNFINLAKNWTFQACSIIFFFFEFSYKYLHYPQQKIFLFKFYQILYLLGVPPSKTTKYHHQIPCLKKWLAFSGN